MLNLNRLRMLSELSRLGTLAKVAESLAYSPSAISQQLGVLEKETGVQLLETVGRGVKLTPAALVLAAHTDGVLARLEEAESELATFRGGLTLRLATFQSAVIGVAPRALTLLAENHPHINVELSQRMVHQSYEGLLAHEFDIIIGEEFPGLPAPAYPGTVRNPLLKDALRLLLPVTGALAGPPTRLADLAQAPWAFDPPHTVAGQWSRNVCREAGFEPIVKFETNDPLLQANLVREGLALALVPSLIPAEALPGARSVALADNPHRALYTVVRAGNAAHPAVIACKEALETAARENVILESDFDLES